METDTRTEAPIVRIEPDGPPVKTLHPVRWAAPIIYVLEDGTRQPAKNGGYSTKRSALESQGPRDVHSMWAVYYDGKFRGTRIRVRTIDFLQAMDKQMDAKR